MITRRTKIQLVIFVLITLVGVSYVGARYARLDRLFFDDTYTVRAEFAESGGIFAGAEVGWRGTSIGRVEKLEVTDQGVDVFLSIEKDFNQIPADTLAVVANRSAVGEQFVDLQPKVAGGPYLKENSAIPTADTRTPLPTEKLLTDVSNTVNSLPKDDLQTVVTELGLAFNGTGEDLARIIDTSNSFIETADDNFEITTALIRDANTVLSTQIRSESAIRTFARDLSTFSRTLVASDADLRAVIENGSATATELKTFLDQNKVDLAALINNLITTGEVVTKHLPGIEQMLVVYPAAVEGGFTVLAKDPVTGLYDAHFGMIMTETPHVCRAGYEGTNRRPPQEGEDVPMNTDARCTEPPSKANARGAQNSPRPGARYRTAPGITASTGTAAAEQSPQVATYDPATGELVWGEDAAAAATPAPAGGATSVYAPNSLGADSWKWLYLYPLAAPSGPESAPSADELPVADKVEP